jgi:hypothetical protein
LLGKPEGKRPLEDLNVCGRIILKWILEWSGMGWTDKSQDRDKLGLL